VAELDDLIARYLSSGDEEAADEVVRRTRPKLLAAARRIGSPQDAEDAVHTAYLSLLHKRGGALDAPVMPWLVTAVVRIAYRRKAKERKHAELVRRLARAGASPGPAAAAARNEELAKLRAGVDRLPGKYRDVVVLHYLEGLPTNDVATLLDVSPSAVKKRLQRARALLLGSLPPWIALPLLYGPWLVADLARSPGALAWTGGTMKAKTTVVLAVVTLAAGTAGFGAAVATGARPAAPRQRAEADRSLELLDRLARLEERARMLHEENRALRRGAEAAETGPAGSDPADRAAAGVPDRRQKEKESSEVLERWRELVKTHPTVEVLRQGGEVARKSGNVRAVEAIYRDALSRLGESSPGGREILLQLGHLHRAEKDCRKSDESYERLRSVTGARTKRHADAVFQLAWNRRFEEHWNEALRLFDDASRLPGGEGDIAAVSRYAIGSIYQSLGRKADARAEWEALVRDYAGHPSGVVRYYHDLARKELAVLD